LRPSSGIARRDSIFLNGGDTIFVMVSGVRFANACRTTLERSARCHAGLDYARPPFDFAFR